MVDETRLENLKQTIVLLEDETEDMPQHMREKTSAVLGWLEGRVDRLEAEVSD